MARADEKRADGGGEGGTGPRAMGRVLRLFRLLARQQRSGMSLTDLSVALDVPKSTLLGTLKPLAADGFLLAEASLYRLGPAAFRLAGTILTAWSAPELIRHYLGELADATQESVGFAIADWEIGQVIYTDAINSTQPVHYAMRAGLRAPLYASAAGRVLLAYAPAKQREEYLARGSFKALTPSTRTTSQGIRESLESVEQEGYCASFGEMLKDTAAIAAPIFDGNDIIVGALMLAAPIDRMRQNFDRLLAELLRCACQASGLTPGSESPPSLQAQGI